jgi:2-polyprenyl-3-methyl-5-hydroxy-6-metoxy-1,4-benzoquinol methylase
MIKKKVNEAYKNYSEIAKHVSDDRLYILSGRYSFMRKKYNLIFEDIFQKLEINKKDDILDIGTGDGELIKLLSKKTKSATTIDSPSVIDRISKDKKIKYIKGHLIRDKIKFKKKFSKILVYSVIQYFQNTKEVNNFIKLIIKLLKDNGSILIGDIPNADMNLRYKKTKDFKKLSKEFNKKRNSNFSEIDKKFHNMFVQKKNIIFNDKLLFLLLKKYNTKNVEAYILPQRNGLPYNVNRVDLLIKKR